MPIVRTYNPPFAVAGQLAFDAGQGAFRQKEDAYNNQNAQIQQQRQLAQYNTDRNFAMQAQQQAQQAALAQQRIAQQQWQDQARIAAQVYNNDQNRRAAAARLLFQGQQNQQELLAKRQNAQDAFGQNMQLAELAQQGRMDLQDDEQAFMQQKAVEQQKVEGIKSLEGEAESRLNELIQQREQLPPDAQQSLDQAANSFRKIKAQRSMVWNQDGYAQTLSKWMENFEGNRWEEKLKPPPTLEEQFDQSVVKDEDGVSWSKDKDGVFKPFQPKQASEPETPPYRITPENEAKLFNAAREEIMQEREREATKEYNDARQAAFEKFDPDKEQKPVVKMDPLPPTREEVQERAFQNEQEAARRYEIEPAQAFADDYAGPAFQAATGMPSPQELMGMTGSGQPMPGQPVPQAAQQPVPPEVPQQLPPAPLPPAPKKPGNKKATEPKVSRQAQMALDKIRELEEIGVKEQQAEAAKQKEHERRVQQNIEFEQKRKEHEAQKAEVQADFEARVKERERKDFVKAAMSGENMALLGGNGSRALPVKLPASMTKEDLIKVLKKYPIGTHFVDSQGNTVVKLHN